MTTLKITCPVCGKSEFYCANSFEICPVCYWENEEFAYNDPDSSGGANTLSLNQYKKKWENKHRKGSKNE